MQADTIPECKPKDKGKPLAALLVGINAKEHIVGIFSLTDYSSGHIVFATKNGLIKRSELQHYDTRNKKLVACGLGSGDEIISVSMQRDETDWLIAARSGMAIRFHSTDVTAMGRSAKGVKGISLEKGDSVVMACPIDAQDDLVLFTDQGYAKITKVSNFDTQRRSGKGVKAVTLLKNGATGTYVAAAFCTDGPCGIIATLKSGQTFDLSSEQLDRSGRTSKGKSAVLTVLGDCVASAYRSSLT